PAPPWPGLRGSRLEVGGGEGPAIADLAAHFVDEACLLAAKDVQLVLDVAGVGRGGARHAPAPQRMTRHRQQGSLVRPELEQGTLAPATPGQRIELRAVIGA